MDWQALTIEPDGAKDTKCTCCGNDSRTVWGFVRGGTVGIAAYFVQWTVGKPEHDANFDVIIGKWGEGTSKLDRQVVCLLYRASSGFMVVDAINRPVASGTMGTPMKRDQVMGTPLAPEVFAVVDAVFVTEPRIQELRDRQSHH